MVSSRQRISGVAAMSASLVLLIPTTASSAAAATPDTTGSETLTEEVAGLTASELSQEIPTFTSGVLEDEGGAPAGSGHTVVLQAWPNAEQLATLQPGETVKMTPVAYDTTDANGFFDIKIKDPSLLDPYLNPDGKVDFEVVAVDGDNVATYSFPSGPPIETARGQMPPADDLVSGEVRKDIDLVPMTELPAVPVDPSLEPDLQPIEEVVLDPGTEVPATAEIPKACGTTYVGSLGTAWANVGYGYAYPGATMKFTYSRGASSSLGVGVSSTGKFGSFKASGTASKASTASVSFPATSSFKIWKTKFTYGKYLTSCVTNGIYTGGYYSARVNGYAGGASVTTVAGAPTANYCVSHTAGSEFTKDTTTAFESGGGADTSGLIGIDMSARTGYSSTAKITFTFAKTMKLCGTNAYPGSSAKRLVAKP